MEGCWGGVWSVLTFTLAVESRQEKGEGTSLSDIIGMVWRFQLKAPKTWKLESDLVHAASNLLVFQLLYV
jgi:hypothetical protein